MERMLEQDTWFHHILPGGYLKSTAPRLKAKYIQNQLDHNPRTDDRPWEGEVSGRALSIASDIRSYATEIASQFNNPGLRFRAVAHSKVLSIRNASLDAFLDPTNDPAHALLTVEYVEFAEAKEGIEPKISIALCAKIAELLAVGESEDEVQELEVRCGLLSD